ncbi:hypothetical protein POBR111598_09915 [Polynucleobacter brandtiae]
MILPVALALPIVMAEKPSVIKSSSDVSRFKVPAAPAKPMVAEVVFGAIVRVLEPETLAPKLIESVVIANALAPIVIVPPAPVTTEPAVMAVAPRTFTAPTAPFRVVLAEPELIVSVGVVAVASVLMVELNKISPVELKEVLRLINTALL